ncbi:hypothetical protein HYW42_01145 [Candidatus Daviesbacteria bacterium]|nr:hypothetical protein [Candidatus Daviesbacteria bacterium]
MNTTQQHLPIRDIKDDLVLLKDGGSALVLQVGAVNFGLLSEREQIAIISSFAQMLNSLSFSIQILIHSERLNLSSYTQKLEQAQKMQTNPLLSSMIGRYKTFIQKIVKENDVLDKKFYLVIPAYSIELGIGLSTEDMFTKAKTLLLPRKDQIIRQLSRISLRSNQLSTRELVLLFYNIYNYSPNQLTLTKPTQSQIQVDQVQLKNPQPAQPPVPSQVEQTVSVITQPIRDTYTSPSKRVPFVVEELTDN